MGEKELIERIGVLEEETKRLRQELEDHTHYICGTRCYYSHNQVSEPCEILSLKRTKMIGTKEEFDQTYVSDELYKDYIRSCELTPRFTVEWIKKERKGSQEEVKEELRQSGEDPEERCILVGLSKPLSEDLTLPGAYKGIKVCTGIVDEKGVIRTIQ